MTYFVYGVFLKETPIYVGLTTDLISRKYQHMSNFNKFGPINSYMRKNIIIECIDKCNNREVASVLETYWINQFQAWGFQLENYNQIAAKVPHKRIKTLTMVRLSETQVEQLKPLIGYNDISKISEKLNVTAELIRVGISGKKNIRKEYYEFILNYFNINLVLQ